MRTRGYTMKHRPVIRGFDSETHDGIPFLLTCSDGSWLDLRGWTPGKEMTLKILDFIYLHSREINVWYNISFDMGAILKPWLLEATSDEIDELRKMKRAAVGPFELKIVNGKGFEIRRGHHDWKGHFDIANFYRGSNGDNSLEDVARDFLGEGKDPMDREKLGSDWDYVNRNWADVVKYGVKDAELTARLGDILVDSVYELYGVYPRVLYSNASVSKAWLQVHKTWLKGYYRKFAKENPHFAQIMYRAYRGGIFLANILGKVDDVYEYDINSAYPAALRGLPRIDYLTWRVYPGYVRGLMGFHLVGLKYDGKLPVPYRTRRRNLYPRSDRGLMTFLTTPEVEYLSRRGMITHVYWSLVGDGPRTAAFPEVGEMYNRRLEEKRLYKATKDKRHDIAQWGIKIVMNALYGVLAQAKPHVGAFTHYAYAAYITALTRIRIWWLVDRVGPDNVVGVATDALITTQPVKSSNIDVDSLGGWKTEFAHRTVYSYQNGLRITVDPSKPMEKELRKRGFPTLTPENLETAEGTEMAVVRRKPRRLFESLTGKEKRVQEISSFVETEKTIRLLPMYLVSDWSEPLRFEILNTRPVRRIPFEVDRPEYIRPHPSLEGNEDEE